MDKTNDGIEESVTELSVGRKKRRNISNWKKVIAKRSWSSCGRNIPAI